MVTLDKQEIVTALDAVNDPHIPASLQNMGMLAGVEVDGDHVQVRVRIPCMACPGTAMLREGIDEAVRAIPGVGSVEVIEDWADPWDRGLVKPGTQNLMREHGIQL